MKLIILADQTQKEELLSQGVSTGTELVWIQLVDDFFTHSDADGFIDLLFDGNSDRIELLKKSYPTPLIINSPVITLSKLNLAAARVNGWPGFLGRPVVEVAAWDKAMEKQVENIFQAFNRKICFTGDDPGFISGRIISMIINEAYFALEQDISTKEEIDTALKLGTNYPFGPFEWSKKIGLKNIADLLNEMSATEPSYAPCTLLVREATA